NLQLLANVEAVVRPDGNRDGAGELGQHGRTAIAAGSARAVVAVAGHRGDDPVGRHAADPPDRWIGDVEAAIGSEPPTPPAGLRLARQASVASQPATPGAHHRADARRHGAGGLPPPVAAVDDPVQRAVGVMRADRPAPQADAARIERADEATPGPPHGDLHARLRACDRIARIMAEAARGVVLRWIGVADAHRDRLLSLEDLSVGVLAVPDEERLLIGRRREGLLVEVPRDADLQVDPP